MVQRRNTRAKKGVVSVDFEGVESGGRSVPDGHYLAKPHKYEKKTGEDSGEQYLSFRWKVLEGKSKGATVFDNVSLQPQSLWRFRTMLERLGYEVPDGSMDIDLDELVAEDGPTCMIEITNEEYDGKDRPRVTDFLASEEGSTPEEEEEEEEEEDGGDEEEEELTFAEVRKGAQVKIIDSEENEYWGEITSKTKTGLTLTDGDGEEIKFKKAEIESIFTASLEEEEEEEEEEEPEPAPRKKTASKKKASPSRGKTLRLGSKVKFKDEDGGLVKGVISEINGEDVSVEDANGDIWEVDMGELSAA